MSTHPIEDESVYMYDTGEGFSSLRGWRGGGGGGGGG